MTFDEKINKATCHAILMQFKAADNSLIPAMAMQGIRILATSSLESIPALCMSIARLPAVSTLDQALTVTATVVLLAMIEDRDELDQDEILVKFIQARRATAVEIAVEIAMTHLHGTETVQ